MNQFSNLKDKKRKHIVTYFNNIINDITISRKIEQSIYNYIIDLSKEKNIQKRWDNIIFTNLYNSKVISIYSNLKKDSYIQNNQLFGILNIEKNPWYMKKFKKTNQTYHFLEAGAKPQM